MTYHNGIYKKYNITGRVVKVKFQDDTYGQLPIRNLTIPVKITAEYRKFLCGTVMPHHNPAGLGMSNEYPITIDKYKLFSKAILMSE